MFYYKLAAREAAIPILQVVFHTAFSSNPSIEKSTDFFGAFFVYLESSFKIWSLICFIPRIVG